MPLYLLIMFFLHPCQIVSFRIQKSLALAPLKICTLTILLLPFNNCQINFLFLNNIFFFRYLQVRSFAHKTFQSFPNLPHDSVLDGFLTPIPSLKGSISYIYNQIILLCPESLKCLEMQWDRDLGELISEEVWSEILKQVHKSSICVRHGLIQSKLVHRTYYTNARLSKFHDGVSPACHRCQHSPGDFIHSLLLCPSLQNYWSEVMRVLLQINGEGFKLDAFGALFGVFPSLVSL